MPTKVHVMLKAYNSYGGDNAISLIGGLISIDAPHFGKAIEDVDIEVCFRCTKGPKKTLESMYDEFHSSLEALPKSRFQRKKKQLLLEYESAVCKAEELRKPRGTSAKVLKLAYAEVRGQLAAVLTKKIKKADDFDSGGFLNWVDRQSEKLPKNKAELDALRARVEAHRKAEFDSLDEWERLGLDWDGFHPDARQILDSPYFWQQANNFSPNGSDTGSDVLSMYRDWSKRNRRRSSEVFFKNLMASWEVDCTLKKNDDFSRKVHSDAIVGLAFAHVKLEGRCPTWAQREALASIERRTESLSEEHPDWDLLGERLATYAQLAEKLRAAPSSDKL